MKTHRVQKNALIVAAIGLIMYFAGKAWASQWGANHADANIGAGLLGLAGLALGSVALLVFIIATLFNRQ